MSTLINKVKCIIGEQQLKKKNVYIGKTVVWDESSRFEGYNAVARRSSFLHSSMGLGSYIANDTYIRNTEIGRFCSIGKNVRVVDVAHPSRDFVSSSPSFFSVKPMNRIKLVDEEKFEEFAWLENHEGVSVSIGNDVWIGDGALILGGHRIGDGAIIGAGAVVTKDVPPYAIVGGVPAKLLRYRFTEEEIAFLEEYKWWDKDVDWLRKHAESFGNIKRFMADVRENKI